MKKLKNLFLYAGLILCVPLFAFAAPILTGGSVSSLAGNTVTLPISFDPTSASVSGLQFNLTVPVGLSTGAVTAGGILTAAGKSVSSNLSGNTWTFIIFGLNQTPIGAGSLVSVQLTVAPGTAAGNLSLPVSGVIYADPNGSAIAAGTSTGGSVTVTLPAPVISSAGTATGQVKLAFSYQISATNNAAGFNATGLPSGLTINTTTGLISGTPTSAGTSNITLSATNAGGTGTKTLSLTINPSACDMNSDGATNANDLQLTVNQAIGLNACSTADINKDSLCNVIDVQRVVNAVLGGACVVTP